MRGRALVRTHTRQETFVVVVPTTWAAGARALAKKARRRRRARPLRRRPTCLLTRCGACRSHRRWRPSASAGAGSSSLARRIGRPADELGPTENERDRAGPTFLCNMTRSPHYEWSRSLVQKATTLTHTLTALQQGALKGLPPGLPGVHLPPKVVHARLTPAVLAAVTRLRLAVIAAATCASAARTCGGAPASRRRQIRLRWGEGRAVAGGRKVMAAARAARAWHECTTAAEQHGAARARRAVLAVRRR